MTAVVYRYPTSHPTAERNTRRLRVNWFAVGVVAGCIAISVAGWWVVGAGGAAAYHVAHITLEKLFHAY